MKKYIFILLFFTPLFLFGKDTLDVEKIIQKHIEAIGGKKTLKEIKNITFEKRIEAGDYVVKQIAKVIPNNSIRVETNSYGQKIIMAYDGRNNEAWQINPFISKTNEPILLDDVNTTQLKMQMEVFGQLYNYKKKGIKVNLEGEGKEGRREVYILTLTYPTSFIDTIYIDKKDFTVKKIINKYAESFFSDYEYFGSFLFPTYIEVISKKGNMTIVTEEIHLNDDFDLEIFTRTK